MLRVLFHQSSTIQSVVDIHWNKILEFGIEKRKSHSEVLEGRVIECVSVYVCRNDQLWETHCSHRSVTVSNCSLGRQALTTTLIVTTTD